MNRRAGSAAERRPPALIVLLGVIGAALFVLPLIGLIGVTPWSRLTDLLTDEIVIDALVLSLAGVRALILHDRLFLFDTGAPAVRVAYRIVAARLRGLTPGATGAAAEEAGSPFEFLALEGLLIHAVVALGRQCVDACRQLVASGFQRGELGVDRRHGRDDARRRRRPVLAWVRRSRHRGHARLRAVGNLPEGRVSGDRL